MSFLVGRASEQKELQTVYEDNRPHFVVIYGRRRVGKTYLIKEYFKNKFAFYATGVNNSNKNIQLQYFYNALCSYSKTPILLPKNWMEAFSALRKVLEHQPSGKKKVIFIDELSWLDTPRSGFLTAFEWFWNSWASAQNDILLITCSSATSWIVKKIFRNHGGLYGRVTRRIHLYPFTLADCEQYLAANRIKMSRMEQIMCYMVMGGIPYYLSLLDPKLSLAQNLDILFFSPQGQLAHEYQDMFHALFNKADDYLTVVETLARKKEGLSRNEIIKYAKLPNGGATSTILDDLENCDIIRKYTAYGKLKRDVTYQLIDFYTLFYYSFQKNEMQKNPNFWTENLGKPRLNTWLGYAFEQVCFYHIYQIKKALGIHGVHTNCSAWSFRGDDVYDGAQIDLLIERADNVINVCEIKFCKEQYAITKAYDEVLREKLGAFRHVTKSNKALRLTFITPFGLKQNMYKWAITNEVTIDDLFQS